MSTEKLPEVWLRGPLPEIPTLLQPVAHALLQAREEVNELMKGFPEDKLWQKPLGLASVAFHLQHIPGVLDRLFTYAGGEQLTQKQLEYLAFEGRQSNDNTGILLDKFNAQIENTIRLIAGLKEETLTEPRYVGRKKLPSTVLGLIFHSAEHTMRHVGQLLVTVRIITHE